MARYSNRPARQVQRRRRVWARQNSAFNLTPGEVSAQSLFARFQNDITSELIGITTVRMIGTFGLHQPVDAADEFRVYMGIAVVSTRPDKALGESVPNPAGQFHADWIYHTVLHPYAEEPFVRQSFDIKSGRKIDEPDEELVVCAATPVGTALTPLVDFHVSTLVLLS